MHIAQFVPYSGLKKVIPGREIRRSVHTASTVLLFPVCFSSCRSYCQRKRPSHRQKLLTPALRFRWCWSLIPSHPKGTKAGNLKPVHSCNLKPDPPIHMQVSDTILIFFIIHINLHSETTCCEKISQMSDLCLQVTFFTAFHTLLCNQQHFFTFECSCIYSSTLLFSPSML